MKKILSMISILFLAFSCFLLNTNAEEIKIVGAINVSNPDNLNQGFIATFTNLLNESEVYEFVYEMSESNVEKPFFLAGNTVYKVLISFTDKWTENDFMVLTTNGENIDIVVVDGAVFNFDWVLKKKNVEQSAVSETTAVETRQELTDVENQPSTAEISKENISPPGIKEILKKHSWSLILVVIVCLFPRIYKFSKILITKKGL